VRASLGLDARPQLAGHFAPTDADAYVVGKLSTANGLGQHSHERLTGAHGDDAHFLRKRMWTDSDFVLGHRE
jgi:hypothetical protein